MKTFIARPLSACKVRSSSSNLFDNSYDKESITRFIIVIIIIIIINILLYYYY